MKSLIHITEGIDENGNIYKEIRTQDFKSLKTKTTNVYYFNGVKVTNHQRWTVIDWINNNDRVCKFEEIKKYY